MIVWACVLAMCRQNLERQTPDKTRTSVSSLGHQALRRLPGQNAWTRFIKRGVGAAAPYRGRARARGIDAASIAKCRVAVEARHRLDGLSVWGLHVRGCRSQIAVRPSYTSLLSRLARSACARLTRARTCAPSQFRARPFRATAPHTPPTPPYRLKLHQLQ